MLSSQSYKFIGMGEVWIIQWSSYHINGKVNMVKNTVGLFPVNVSNKTLTKHNIISKTVFDDFQK